MVEVERLRGLADVISDLACDADVDAREARLAGDLGRQQYLLGERHGLLQAAKLVRGDR